MGNSGLLEGTLATRIVLPERRPRQPEHSLSPTRLDAAKQAYKKAGGELKAFYLTLGQYDAVAIVELPDDTALAKMALALGAQGNVRTETLRVFNETEFRKIVSELP